MARRSVPTGSSGTRAAVPRQNIRVQSRALFRETTKYDVDDQRRGGKGFNGRMDRNLRRLVGRKAVNPGRNRGERHGGQPIGPAELKRTAIAGAQRLCLTASAAVPDRADCMDHMTRREKVALRDLGIAGRASSELPALG